MQPIRKLTQLLNQSTVLVLSLSLLLVPYTSTAQSTIAISEEASPTYMPVAKSEFSSKTVFTPNTTADDISLALHLSRTFSQPLTTTIKIIEEIDKRVDAVFPTRTDVLAIIMMESRFDPKARHMGSFGLMQIHGPSHHRKIGPAGIYDIETNVQVGVGILKEYHDITGSRKGAVLAYNAGIGNYLKGRSNPNYWNSFSKSRASFTNR